MTPKREGELDNLKILHVTKVHNISAEGKDEVEMQTPVDDSSIFTEASTSTQAFP